MKAALVDTYAVIFRTKRTAAGKSTKYQQTAQRMEELAKKIPGYLGISSINDDDFGIAISYWQSQEAIAQWKADCEHSLARKMGKDNWYQEYSLEIAKVVRSYDWSAHEVRND